MKKLKLSFVIFLMAFLVIFPILTIGVHAQENEVITADEEDGILSTSELSSHIDINMGPGQTTLSRGTTAQINATVNKYWSTSKPYTNFVTPSGLYLAKHSGEDTVTATDEMFYRSESRNIKVLSSDSIVFEAFDPNYSNFGIVLTVGETFKNPASTSTDTEIRYSSYDPSIASVDSNGNVTALSEGVTKIYAQDQTGEEDSYIVYVKNNSEVSLFLSSKSVCMSAGAVAKIQAVQVPVMDDGNIVESVTSSNPEVAEVKEVGTSRDPVANNTSILILAKKAGSATITCKFTDGSTQSCKVTVVDSVSSLTLNQSRVTLEAGETSTLYATNTKAPIRCFMSSNDKVAQVDDNGNIYAISHGTATITAYLDNGETATCTVTVNYCPATSVKLSQASASVDMGDELTLKATVKPFGADQKVSWSSSDLSVASVSNGIVKGLKPGTATITAMNQTGLEASCIVTVPVPEAKSISIETSTYNVDIGSTIKLKAIVYPSEADQTVTWKSLDTKVATVSSDGVVTGKANGSTSIIATTKDKKISKEIIITVNPVEENPVEEKGKPIYRLYLPSTGEHLYTPDYNEYQTLYKKYGWGQEGVAWYAPESGTAVYRLYNPSLKNHLYTTDTNEVKVLTSKYGWVKDNDGKPLYYSGGDVNIYRVYNEGLSGMHHLTTNLNEYNTLPKYGWEQEGVKLFAVELGNPYDKTDFYNK